MSGGFKTGTPSEVPVFLGSFRSADESWKVNAFFTDPTKFTTFAYCAK